MPARLWYLVLYLLYFLPLEQALITKTKNAYSGIVVTFHKSVPENTELLLKTVALFKDASGLLYNATQGRAIFGNITIVVPMSWNSTAVKSTISELSDVSYEKTYGDFFREADIRIDPHKDPYFKDSPYTLQTGGCFEPGQYIHLTPEFVLDEFNQISDSYGPTDLIIVHEWMHLRYGIFDEYGINGDPDFPLFYFEDGKVRVSACDRNIKGSIVMSNGEKCTISNRKISEECNFYPDPKETTSKASIMSRTFIDSVKEFCDEDIEANNGQRHNSKAPTKQNFYCDGLSVLEVLERHSDFENSPKWEVPYQSPKFRVLQPVSLDPRIVLVLDVSSSMNGTMGILSTAGTIFVEDQIPEGSYIGIVTYSTNARTVQDLVKINSGNRKAVSDKVPKRAGGNTGIGSGLLEALNVLKRANQTTEGATIVLMTDGVENENPKINKVLPILVNAKVKVNTLAFGTKASNLLENVAKATNGKTYFLDLRGGVATADLQNIFGDTITIQADVDLQSEQIFRDHLITDNHQNVFIDRELGNNTIFMVSGEVASVNMELRSPNGTIYNKESRTEYIKDAEKKIIQFRIPMAESGNWSIAIKNSAKSVTVELLVTSAPKIADEQPVRAHAWLSAIQIKYPYVPRVFARVTKGTDVIIHADVQATIKTNNETDRIILRDDGSGADKLRNDGIYSAYFLPTENGRYSVFARVLNSGSALIKRSRTLSRAQPIPQENVNGRQKSDPASSFDLSYFGEVNEPEHLSEGTSTEVFTRTADGGSFRMEGIIAGVDKIPPNRVNDLHVLTINITDEAEMIVTLQWTSPGDNMTEGNATHLDIRTSKTDQSLRRENFQEALTFNESHLYLNDTLKPAPGKIRQILTLLIPIDLQLDKGSPFDLYFALKAADEALNWGEVSNIAVGHYGYIFPEPEVTTTVWTTTDITKESVTNDDMTENTGTSSVAIWAKDATNQTGSLGAAIGVSVGAICLAIFLVIGLLVYRRRKRLV